MMRPFLSNETFDPIVLVSWIQPILGETCMHSIQGNDTCVSQIVRLEAERVRPVTLRKREGSRKVLGQELVTLLDSLEELLVERLLVRNPVLGNRCLVGRVCEERRLSLHLGGLLTAEVCVVELSVHIHAANVHLRAGGNHVSLVDAANRHTVKLEGARNEKKTALELLQEDDTTTTEAASKEDEYSAGGDTVTQLGRLGGLAHHLLGADVVGGVEARRLGGRHVTLATVLGATDGLLNELSSGLLSLGGRLAVRVLVATLLRVDLAAAKATDVRANSAVADHGHCG